MEIQLITIGRNMPAWVATAYEDFAKRLPADYQLTLTEIKAEHRGKNADIKRLTDQEGKQQLAAIKSGAHIIALDERGTSWSTKQLANKLHTWHDDDQDIALLVGGPDGLAPECKAKALHTWSLSPLTLPHSLVRVIVVEQLYRAWSIISGHPYHRN